METGRLRGCPRGFLLFKRGTLMKIRPRKDHRDVDLISDALPFGRLWYGGPDAVAMQFSQ